MAVSCVIAEPVKAEGPDGTGGFSKYIKRKKLDPLETYVPSVILTQSQLQEVGAKLAEAEPNLLDARGLLRSGPASSLRSDIKAVAQYASEAGSGEAANAAVGRCLSALEDLDSMLFNGSRSNDKPKTPLLQKKLTAAISALDSLLETVPSPVLEKSREVAAAYY